MQTKNTRKDGPIKHDPIEGDPIKKDHKTSPPGMAPDEAHTSKGVSPGSRMTEVEETFNNSPQNAQAKQTEHRK